MMYIKFILLQLLMVIAFVVNFFVFPLLSFPLRKLIVKYPTLFKWLGLYWFSDDSETWGTDEQNYVNNWFGVYELLQKEDESGKLVGDYEKFKTLNGIQKYILSIKWAVFRNPNWNLQVAFKPKDGDRYAIREIINIGDYSIFQWRNKTIFGKQFVTYKIEGTKYFRYSYTKEFGYLGKDYINVMLGASNNRFIVKLRLFN